jgi:hypothetical protein
MNGRSACEIGQQQVSKLSHFFTTQSLEGMRYPIRMCVETYTSTTCFPWSRVPEIIIQKWKAKRFRQLFIPCEILPFASNTVVDDNAEVYISVSAGTFYKFSTR